MRACAPVRMSVLHPKNTTIKFPTIMKRPSHNPTLPIVICLDGTSGSFGSKEHSNVFRLFEILNDKTQRCYYQSGVGTFVPGLHHRIFPIGHIRYFWQKAWRLLDTISGYSLEEHVVAAYTFLMKAVNSCGNTAAPKIYIFGFSRGALAARVLAAMVAHVGLLREESEHLVATAWALYVGWEVAEQPEVETQKYLAQFKRTFANTVQIDFLGLWDTVNLVGITREWVFPYSQSVSLVLHVRHAVSLDERRGKYRPMVLAEPEEEKSNLDGIDEHGVSGGPSLCTEGLPNSRSVGEASWWSGVLKWFSKLHRNPQNIRHSPGLTCLDSIEVWFAGDHGDVGGGWPASSQGFKLSHLTLMWMVNEAEKLGVEFKIEQTLLLAQLLPLSIAVLCHHDVLALGRRSACCGVGYDHAESTEAIARANNGVDNDNGNGIAGDQSIFDNPGPSLPLLSSNGQPDSPLPYNSNGELTDKKPPISNELFLQSPGNLSCKSHPNLCKYTHGESLGYSLLWWFLELLPFGTAVQEHGLWRTQWKPNWGHRRSVVGTANIHWTVFYRLHFVHLYAPPNLPFEIGPMFLALIEEIISLDIDAKEYVVSLNLNTIRYPSNHAVWTKLSQVSSPTLHGS